MARDLGLSAFWVTGSGGQGDILMVIDCVLQMESLSYPHSGVFVMIFMDLCN
jgi:hypothetical protein